jgi:hypothetical protein
MEQKNLFTSVYICLHLFTSVYICLHLFTSVYICLHLFTFVYICLFLFTSLVLWNKKVFHGHVWNKKVFLNHVWNKKNLKAFNRCKGQTNNCQNLQLHCHGEIGIKLISKSNTFILVRKWCPHTLNVSGHHLRTSLEKYISGVGSIDSIVFF